MWRWRTARRLALLAAWSATGLPVAGAAAPPASAAAALCWSKQATDPALALREAERALAALPSAVPLAPAEVVARLDLRLCRGRALVESGSSAEARSDFDAVAAEAERLGERALLGKALAERGELAYYRGDFTAALEDHGRAHALALALGDESLRLESLGSIAHVYADPRVGAYDRALEYYRQLLALHTAAGDVAEQAGDHFNLGSTLEQKGDLQGALAELQRAVELDRGRGDADEVAYDERAVAAVLVKLGRPGEALLRLKGVFARYTATGNAEMLARARLTRGIARRSAGDLAGAISDLDAARRRFAADGNDRFLVRIEEERAAAFAASGDLAGALAAREGQLALERKLAEQVRDEHTSRLRVQFETAQKERENAALQRENRLRGQALRDAERIRDLQRWVLALGSVLVVLLLGLALRQLVRARLLQRLAMTDELTRLPNRRSLLAQAEPAWQRSQLAAEPLALLALDVDHFKVINDEHGHAAGDRVLQRVAHAARGALRTRDLLGRVGGEEFLALLPGTEERAAAEIAERVRAAVGQLVLADLAPGLRVSVSVGVATRLAEDTDLAATVRRADGALYRAKQSGRDRVVVAEVVAAAGAPALAAGSRSQVGGGVLLRDEVPTTSET